MLSSVETWAAIPLPKLIKQAGGIADNVPIRSMDDALEMTRKGGKNAKWADEILESEKKLTKSLTRSDMLIRQVENSLGRLDSSTQQLLRNADEADLATAFLMCRGAKNVSNHLPDVAMRADFMKSLDGNTLCVLGRYDDLVGEAHTFQRG